MYLLFKYKIGANIINFIGEISRICLIAKYSKLKRTEERDKNFQKAFVEKIEMRYLIKGDIKECKISTMNLRKDQ